jgi:hypothetical protein
MVKIKLEPSFVHGAIIGSKNPLTIATIRAPVTHICALDRGTECTIAMPHVCNPIAPISFPIWISLNPQPAALTSLPLANICFAMCWLPLYTKPLLVVINPVANIRPWVVHFGLRQGAMPMAAVHLPLPFIVFKGQIQHVPAAVPMPILPVALVDLSIGVLLLTPAMALPLVPVSHIL